MKGVEVKQEQLSLPYVKMTDLKNTMRIYLYSVYGIKFIQLRRLTCWRYTALY